MRSCTVVLVVSVGLLFEGTEPAKTTTTSGVSFSLFFCKGLGDESGPLAIGVHYFWGCFFLVSHLCCVLVVIYVCVYIYIYTHTHTHLSIYAYIYIYLFFHTYTQIDTQLHK